MLILIILFNLLNVTDILITRKYLSLGIKEFNPFYKFLIQKLNDKWWIAKIVVGILITIVFSFVFVYPQILLILCIVLVLVDCWNLYQIKKQGKQKVCCS